MCGKTNVPDSIKAWVGLFAVGNFVEHYTEIMLHTLFPTRRFKMREPHGRRRRNEIIRMSVCIRLDAKSSEEDIGDSGSDSESESDEIDDNDIKIWKEEVGFSDF